MIALYGPWNLGFAYDKHTLRSVLVGEYSNGVVNLIQKELKWGIWFTN